MIISVEQPAGKPLGPTCTMLHELSVPIHRLGYKHLVIAVGHYAQHDSQSLTKELYPYVANHFHYSDWHAVEHSIRTAILDAWRDRDLEVWEHYFPHARRPPTNKCFLATLAERLQQNTPPENGRG